MSEWPENTSRVLMLDWDFGEGRQAVEVVVTTEMEAEAKRDGLCLCFRCLIEREGTSTATSATKRASCEI